MARRILAQEDLHEAVRDTVYNRFAETVDEVAAAVERDAIVVVGMKHNPHCGRARRVLKAAGQPFTYLGYGSYTGEWRRRSAIKMWVGWHTFPMVFVRGTFVGGANEITALIESGELARMLSEG